MTETNHSTTATVWDASTPWPEFAAIYRTAATQAKATMMETDDLPAIDAVNDAQSPIYQALLAYPVSTPAELVEKIRLIAIDCWDDGWAYDAIAADAARMIP